MWRVCKESGRAWPSLSDDDVLDYMIMEAVAIKVMHEDEEARKREKRKQEQTEARKGLTKQFG